VAELKLSGVCPQFKTADNNEINCHQTRK